MRVLHLEIRDFYLTIERSRKGLSADTDVVVHFPEEPGFAVTMSAGADAKGVRARMPLEKAKAVLPQGVFVPADYQMYAQISEQINNRIREEYPFTEQLDFYEWFCDISDAGPDGFREVLSRAICRPYPFKLDFSVARNKFLAKLGNDIAQDLDVESARDVLNATKLEHFWGIPRRWINDLKEMGIETIGEIGGLDANLLDKKFSNTGRRLALLGRGEDDHEVQPFSKPSRLSQNASFRASDSADTHKKLLERLSGVLSEQLQKGGHTGFAIGLEITGGGQRVTNRYRFLLPTARSSSLLVGAMTMLKKMKEMLPSEGPLDLNFFVSEIVCDRNVYQLHGSPMADLEVMSD